MRCVKISCMVALMICTSHAMANMRAARQYWQAPSSSLWQLSAQNITVFKVLHEQLRIACDHDKCHVEATYQIQASQASQLPLEFILPTSAVVVAKVNGISCHTQLSLESSTAWLTSTQADAINGYGRSGWEIYKANFIAPMQQGVNEITVYYTQPLSILEVRYGYFVRSRFVETFTYILAPLKSWVLADDFKLEVEVLTLIQRPERDPWSLFKRRSINCHLPNPTITRQSGWIIYRAKLAGAFADNLLCTLGDSDLIKD